MPEAKKEKLPPLRVAIHLKSGQTINAVVSDWTTKFQHGEINGYEFKGLTSHAGLHLDPGQIAAVEVRQ